MPARDVDKPLPRALIRQLVDARVAEIEGGAKSKRAPRKRAKRAAAQLGADVNATLAALKRVSSKRVRAEMGPRYGIVAKKAFGVPMSKMLAVAKPIGRDHELAGALWKTGWYEARMVACMIDDPARVTGSQMDRWAADFDNWAIVDTVCFKLFDHTGHVFERVRAWSRAEGEFQKRAAFALLASAALHGVGTDADHLRALAWIEREASDPRNFVKKGVGWALRAIGGKRSPKLRAAARTVARRLAASDDLARRWVGKDALKAFSK